MGHLSNTLYLDNPSAALQYAGYGFIGAWIAQFVGHGKVSLRLRSCSRLGRRLTSVRLSSSALQFEGRAPALLTSLFQSLVLAVSVC